MPCVTHFWGPIPHGLKVILEARPFQISNFGFSVFFFKLGGWTHIWRIEQLFFLVQQVHSQGKKTIVKTYILGKDAMPAGLKAKLEREQKVFFFVFPCHRLAFLLTGFCLKPIFWTQRLS